jgi:hypothetical protein
MTKAMSFIEEVLADVRDLKYEITAQQDVILDIKSQLSEATQEQSKFATDLAESVTSQMAKMRDVVVDKMSNLSIQTADDHQEVLVLYGFNTVELWLTLGFVMMVFYVVYRLVSSKLLFR